MSNTKIFSLTFISSLISAFLAIVLYSNFFQNDQEIYQQEKIRATQVAENDILFSDRFGQAFRSALPNDFTKAANIGKSAVVFIESANSSIGGGGSNRSFSRATGSGVIISNDGFIVTNNHVVEGADEVRITLNNNKEYKADVIGFDEATDLALLKIEALNLPFLVFGNSDSLTVGEWVMAVGNPFRLQSTVTAGIVSAKGRNINILEQQGIESFIQTDAAVNPGNSGGALINTNGELVGINTAILSSSGGYEGFSFAVPSVLVKKIVRDLKEFGSVQRGWMGVTIYNIDAPIAENLGLSEIKGVFVDAVSLGGAAKSAGIRKGDVLQKINGIETNTVPQFMELIGQFRPGDALDITYFRDGQNNQVDVVLRNQLNTTDLVAVRKDKLLTDIGFELRNMDTGEINKNKDRGVYVVSVYKNSIVAEANLEPGYIITSVNNEEVNSVNDLVAALKNYNGTVVLNGFYSNYPGEFPYTFRINE